MLPKVRRVPVGLFPPSPRFTRKGRFVTVKVAPNGAGYRRYGVIVPKGVIPGAVRRNRLKRAVYRLLAAVSTRTPEDVIVILKNPPPAGEFSAFEAEIKNLVR